MPSRRSILMADRATRALKVFYFVLTLFFFPLVGLVYYVGVIYPNWPQELGGLGIP